MNRGIAKTVFKIGAHFRNPKLFNEALNLQKSDFYTLDAYKDIQKKKLDKLLAFTKQNSNFYKEKVGLTNSGDSFERLAEFPVISKNDLLNYHDDIQCYNKFEKLIESETSGSSGQPFRFKKDLNWDTLNRASIIRSYWWYGVDIWQKNGYFWGYNFDSKQILKTKVLDTIQNRFRAFRFDKNELEHFLIKLKSSSYLHGYSSIIYEVAQMALEMGYSAKDFPKLKLIKGTSEKIFDYYHSPVKEAFGHKITSEYGAAETGIIAFECPLGRMHINEENVIVEEEDGEAIITNLNAFSIPVIRYKLGDSISISQEKCECGRHSRIISEVLGRVGKKIIGKDNSYPSLTLYYIFKNIALKQKVDIQYQGVQTEKGKIVLNITRSLKPSETAWILEEAKKYFKDDLDIRIEENIDIHNKKGKLKDFISEIN